MRRSAPVHPPGPRTRGVVLALLLTLATSHRPARSQDVTSSGPTTLPPETPAGAASDLSPSLFGDPGGRRSALARRGVTLTGSYTGEVLGNVRGGRRRGVIAEGLLELDVDLDLEKKPSVCPARARMSPASRFTARA